VNAAIRVLLVDDEETFLRNLARLLHARAFTVATAGDGPSAIARLEAGLACDVVVLDVKLPGMDGPAVLRAVKRLRPDAEVIMLTGHATVESGIEAIRAGAFDYLMKPCEIEDLAAKIREAYSVETIRSHPVLWPRNTVAEIMEAPPQALASDASLAKALECFNRQSDETDTEALFVADANGRLAGRLTRRTLVDLAQQHHHRREVTWYDLQADAALLPPGRVGQWLEPFTEHLAPETSLAEAAQRMIAMQARNLPVLAAGRLVGTARLRDILRHIEDVTA
jgi:DNA-binding response OmpR family regulator